MDGWKTKPPSKAWSSCASTARFDYVRMLRIAKQASQKADPDSLIATGGIGYPLFLDAILRYTDNPPTGTVTEAYPAKGGDYPTWSTFTTTRSSARRARRVRGRLHASKRGAGSRARRARKDSRLERLRDRGAESATSAEYPTIGSAEYARNYLIGVHLRAGERHRRCRLVHPVERRRRAEEPRWIAA